MSKNPYAPPQSSAPEDAPIKTERGVAQYLLVLLTVLQLLHAAQYANFFTSLISTGSIPPIFGGLAVLGLACLAIGVVRSLFRPHLGKVFLGIAALGMAVAAAGFANQMSTRGGGLAATFFVILVIGAITAAAGVVLSVRARK